MCLCHVISRQAVLASLYAVSTSGNYSLARHHSSLKHKSTAICTSLRKAWFPDQGSNPGPVDSFSYFYSDQLTWKNPQA